MRKTITSIACFLLFCCFSTNAHHPIFAENGDNNSVSETNSPDESKILSLSAACMDITSDSDLGFCGARLDIPTPIDMNEFSGVDSITYTINGVTTLLDPGATEFSEFFDVGTTSVTISAYDESVITSECTFNVIIQDIQRPSVACPGNVEKDALVGQASMVVNDIAPTGFTENCPGERITYTTSPDQSGNIQSGDRDASGLRFPIGITTVTYIIVDAAGNQSNCSFTVTINPPEDLVFQPEITVDCATDTVTYSLFTKNFNDIKRMQMGIRYDNSALRFISATKEVSGAGGPPNPNLSPNHIWYAWSRPTPISLIDGTKILTIKFKLIGGVNFPLTSIEDIDSGLQIMIDDANGTVDLNDVVFFTELGAQTADTQGPTLLIGCLDLEFEADENSCVANLNIPAPAAQDFCSGIDTITYEINGVVTRFPDGVDSLNADFPVGTTEIRFRIYDGNGNESNCGVDVTVVDKQLPNVECTPNIQMTPISEICGAVATWSVPTATDNCGNVNVTSSHNPGDTFLITTTVLYTFTDDAGNTSFCSFIIDVDNVDTDPPVILNCPTDTVIFAPSTVCGAPYIWVEPTITDACSEAFINSPTFMPGDIFPLGMTTVGYLGFDAQGNQATCNFTVTVRDTTPPSLFCPSTVLAFATESDQCGTIVNSFNLPLAFDNCSDNVGVICTNNPGDFFEVGTTLVTCTAIDDSGNESTCDFSVIVEDQFAPTITCPDDIVVNLDGMLVSGTPGIISSIVANNNCDSVLLSFNFPAGADNCPIGMPTQVEGPTNGTLVALGMETNFGFILSDGPNVSDTCRFNITVNPITDITISGGTGEYCSGDSFTLSVDPIAGATYEWTLPAGNTVAGNTLTLTDITPGVNNGNYTVVCQLADNCESTATITINNIQDAPIFEASASGEGCNANVQLLVAFDNNSPIADSVRWNGPSGYTSTVTEPVLNNPVSGDYIITAYNNSCSTTQTVSLSTVNIPEVSVFSDCGDNGICVGDNCNLIGTTTTDPTLEFNWMAEAGCTININEDGNIANITPVDEGSCVIMYWLSKDGCASDTAFITINVTGAPVAVEDFVAINSGTTQISINVLDNDQITPNVNPSVRAVTQPNDGVVTFNETDQVFLFDIAENFVDLNQFQYEVCYECDGTDLCSQAIVTIELQDTSCTVPSLITPNNDGFNDELIISCLRGEEFPDSEMVIYNQWGDEIYRRKPYGNGVWWDGTYNGEPVSDGTYYYLYTKETGGSVTRGYLTIYR